MTFSYFFWLNFLISSNIVADSDKQMVEFLDKNNKN